MRIRLLAVAAAALIFPVSPLAAQPNANAQARAAIDAGNRAWVDGVKAGDIKTIMATYADNAVDCGPTGECTRGHLEIERHMTKQMASLGLARSARVTTWGSCEHGNVIYEWGQAEAVFAGGKTLVDKYLTVWQRQPGGWKILRNLVIPQE